MQGLSHLAGGLFVHQGNVMLHELDEGCLILRDHALEAYDIRIMGAVHLGGAGEVRHEGLDLPCRFHLRGRHPSPKATAEWA